MTGEELRKFLEDKDRVAELEQSIRRRRMFDREVKELPDDVMDSLFDGVFCAMEVLDPETALYNEVLNIATAISSHRLDQKGVGDY